MKQLPPGWEAKTDPRTGKVFFIDNKTKKTSWTPPTGIIDIPESTQQGHGISVNGVLISDDALNMLKSMSPIPLQSGEYWYDNKCGAVGFSGGPCIGIIKAGLSVGGALSPNSSGGSTGIFFNGRNIHEVDAFTLRKASGVTIEKGSYFLDADGNFGFEGGDITGKIDLLKMSSIGGGGRKSIVTAPHIPDIQNLLNKK